MIKISKLLGLVAALGREQSTGEKEFFIFILLFFRFIKNIYHFFCKFVTLPPVHPAEASYRQMDRR